MEEDGGVQRKNQDQKTEEKQTYQPTCQGLIATKSKPVLQLQSSHLFSSTYEVEEKGEILFTNSTYLFAATVRASSLSA